MEYTLAHIGINCQNEQEAETAAKMLQLMFHVQLRDAGASWFAGSLAELNKIPGRGKHGHIAIGTPDVEASMEELRGKGFDFIPESAVVQENGKLRAIYFTEELCGFAVHLVRIAQ